MVRNPNVENPIASPITPNLAGGCDWSKVYARKHKIKLILFVADYYVQRNFHQISIYTCNTSIKVLLDLSAGLGWMKIQFISFTNDELKVGLYLCHKRHVQIQGCM